MNEHSLQLALRIGWQDAPICNQERGGSRDNEASSLDRISLLFPRRHDSGLRCSQRQLTGICNG